MTAMRTLIRRSLIQHRPRTESLRQIPNPNIFSVRHKNAGSFVFASFSSTTLNSSAPTEMSGGYQHLTLAEVEKICRDALSASGINPETTAAITDIVTSAERDGCHSHGLFRVPGYCNAVLSGTVSGTVEPKVYDVAPGVVKVDAGGGYSPPAILAGRDLALRKARENGISCLAIHNSVHFAALWWEVEALAREGIVSLAFVNSRSFVAHQPGGKRKLYGTNPMAFGFPRAESAVDDDDETLSSETKRGPLVWDQASAAMARGEIQLCERDGHTLPERVAIDRDGNPTTSPAAALEGAQLPFGGHKGSAIAMMVELLAAGLTGSNFSFEAKNDVPNAPTNHGELIIMIDPIVTTGGDDYLRYCELLFKRILEEEGTRLPSTRRYANRIKTPLEGVKIPRSLYEEIVELGSNRNDAS